MTQKRLLIANRGEIACRIQETAQALGFHTVVGFSEADRHAKFVAMANERHPLGAGSIADTYLNQARWLGLIKDQNIHFVHPGYGFLSENADFSERVTAAGAHWVGPSAHAIRAMGLKHEAKALMQAANVPIIPGALSADGNLTALAQAATDMGYPVLIKASAGGGGKGMRIVHDPTHFLREAESCQREATNAFGNPTLLVEKYFPKARHVEVQIFGDAHGNLVHLGTRDCSLQRRHQKVIEEAPALLPQSVLNNLHQSAIAAGQAVQYQNAGTVEFLVSGRDIYFLEMNTRLQVEHPVTEAITGIDCVAWQLTIAEGNPLPKRQADITFHGHAMEARVYAEDAFNGFLPASGDAEYVTFPRDVRVDAGIQAGDAIGIEYDPMIAKIITTGLDREAARRALISALSQTQIAPVKTNITYLQALLSTDWVAANAYHTRSLDTATLTPPTADTSWLAAAVAAARLDAQPKMLGAQFRLNTYYQERVRVTQGDHHWEFTLRKQSEGWQLILDDVAHRFRLLKSDAPRFQVQLDRKDAHVVVLGTPSDPMVLLGSMAVSLRLNPSLAADGEGRGEDTHIKAPMPGRVLRMCVEAQQSVPAGDPLCVLEAMKMEHTLTAPKDVTITALCVTEGQFVEEGTPLIEWESQHVRETS